MAFSEQGEELCGSGSSAEEMQDVTRNQAQGDAHSCALLSGQVLWSLFS